MRLWRQLKTDFLFQFRHGFYYAYLFMVLLYGIIILFLPAAYKQICATLFILSDTSALGFFFIGGVLLLEKKQSLLTNVAVTPLRISEYICSKCVSFLLLSLGSSILIQAATLSPPGNIPLFLYCIISSSLLYTLFGLSLGILSGSVNQYFALSLCYLVFLVPAATYFLKVTPQAVFTVFPLTAAFLLFQASIHSLSPEVWSIAGMLGWNILFYFLGYLVLYRNIYTTLISTRRGRNV